MVELSIIHTNSPVLKTVLHLSNVFLESKIKKILQLCLKFSIIVFLQYVHVIHRRCNSAACLIWKRDVFKLRESFECYDTEFIEMMPHTWNSISLCEHTNEHFIQHESSSVVHILTVCLRYHELHLLYILAEEKYYFEFDSFL